MGSPPPKPTPIVPLASSSSSHETTRSKASEARVFGAKQYERARSQVFASAIETWSGVLAHSDAGGTISSVRRFCPVERQKIFMPDGPRRTLELALRPVIENSFGGAFIEVLRQDDRGRRTTGERSFSCSCQHCPSRGRRPRCRGRRQRGRLAGRPPRT